MLKAIFFFTTQVTQKWKNLKSNKIVILLKTHKKTINSTFNFSSCKTCWELKIPCSSDLFIIHVAPMQMDLKILDITHFIAQIEMTVTKFNSSSALA